MVNITCRMITIYNDDWPHCQWSFRPEASNFVPINKHQSATCHRWLTITVEIYLYNEETAWTNLVWTIRDNNECMTYWWGSVLSHPQTVYCPYEITRWQLPHPIAACHITVHRGCHSFEHKSFLIVYLWSLIKVSDTDNWPTNHFKEVSGRDELSQGNAYISMPHNCVPSALMPNSYTLAP